MDEYGFLNGAGLYFLWNKIKSLFIKQGSKLTDKLTITGNGKLQLNDDGSVVDEYDKPLLNRTTEFDEVDGKKGTTLNLGDTDYVMSLKGKLDTPIYTNGKGEFVGLVTSPGAIGMKIIFSDTPPTDADDNTITFVIR